MSLKCIECEPPYPAYNDVLDNNPVLVTFENNVPCLLIGNTGLRFHIHDNYPNCVWFQDFIPDGCDPRDNPNCTEGNEFKYTSIYAYGFAKTLQTIESNELTMPTEMLGYTNKTQHEMREHLLGSHYSLLQIITPRSKKGMPYYHYQINVISLMSDEKLIKRVNKIAERCEKQIYTITGPVFKPAEA